MQGIAAELARRREEDEQRLRAAASSGLEFTATTEFVRNIQVRGGSRCGAGIDCTADYTAAVLMLSLSGCQGSPFSGG